MKENQWPVGEETFTSTPYIAHFNINVILIILIGFILLILFLIFLFKRKNK
jgi:LPXTG-motif cell wall-anchored protein